MNTGKSDEEKLEELRALIREGIESGERDGWIDGDQAFDEIEIELFGKRLADDPDFDPEDVGDG
jgi:hypothetical protein